MILVDFTNASAERNGLYVNYYGYHATIPSLLRDQCTVQYSARVCTPYNVSKR